MTLGADSSTDRCPSAEELRRFSTGRLAEHAAEAIADHLGKCERCRDLLETIDEDVDPLLGELKVSLGSPVAAAGEAEGLVFRLQSQDGVFWPGTSGGRQPRWGSSSGDWIRGGPAPQMIRCPHCHAFLDLSLHGRSEPRACPHCGRGFHLAAGESDGGISGRGTRTIAHFELLEPQGEGGFGTVWRARDSHLSRTVAVKVPRQGSVDDQRLERFLREARLAAQVDHPNVVRILEVGREGELAYIVSDFVEGVPLGEFLAGQPMPPKEAARLCLQLADALDAAHGSEIVHRDLKPSNILMDRYGNPLITDFGLAKQEADDVAITLEGRLLGTPVYMPPEQARGDAMAADARSDVYSLGAILFEVLTGQPPFRGDLKMLISQILLDEPPRPTKLNGSVPRDLETICLKCLEKQAGKRFQSAAELRDELQRYLDGKPIRSRPVSAAARLGRWCKRRPGAASVGAAFLAVVCCAVGAVSLAYWSSESSLREAETNLYFHEIAAAREKWLSNDRPGFVAELEACPKSMRHIEWGLLRQLLETPVLELPDAGWNVVYRPDGRELATTGGSEPTVQIWDARTGKRSHRLFGHRSWLANIDYSPCGRFLASVGGPDQTVRLWDAVEGARLDVLGRQGSRGRLIRYAPDGSHVISTGHRRAHVWNVETGEEVRRFEFPPRNVRAIAASPTGPQVAMALGKGDRTRVGIWDYTTGECVREIPVGEKTVMCLAYSPDGKVLATSELFGSVHLWQLEPFRLQLTIPGPVSRYSAVTFAPSGELMAGELWDNSIAVWETAKGKKVHTLRGHVPPSRSISFAPDGRSLAVAGKDGVVRVWEITAPQGATRLCRSESPVKDLAISPDGNALAACFADGAVRGWDLATHEELFSVAGEGETAWGLAFSRDGRRVGVAHEDGAVRLYDVGTGEVAGEFAEHDCPLRTLSLSPDGKLAASAGIGKDVYVWNPDTGEMIRSFSVPTIAVMAVAVSPDGRRLAAGDRDAFVTVWDLATGTEIWRKACRKERVWSLAWRPDGEQLAISRGDGSVQLCRGTDGSVVSEFGDLADEQRVDLAFTPDGERLLTATAATAISIWEIPSGRFVLSLAPRPAISNCVAIHPNGRLVASAEYDGSIYLWPARWP